MTVKSATGQTLSTISHAEDRARRMVTWKRVVRAALDTFDVSLKGASIALGYAAQKLSRQLDIEEHDEHFRLCDLEALPPGPRRAILEKLAEGLGCALADLPGEVSFESDLGLLSRVIKETSEVAARHADALKDQHLDPAEAEALMKECMDAVSELQTLHRRCSQAVRERGLRLAAKSTP